MSTATKEKSKDFVAQTNVLSVLEEAKNPVMEKIKAAQLKRVSEDAKEIHGHVTSSPSTFKRGEERNQRRKERKEIVMDVCPNCGWTAITTQKVFSNVMSTYVNPKGEKATFNSGDEKLKVGKTPETAVEWIREDIFAKLPVKEIKVEPPKEPAALKVKA